MAEHRAVDVVVLGAGLQGACVALALAAAGRRVGLVDRSAAPMTGASLNNEGKVHLGYVYGLDPTLETQRTMLKGALSFAPLLDRWLGPQPWPRLKTAGISYAVMPDSLLPADVLEGEYARLVAQIADVADDVAATIDEPAHYLGHTLDGTIRRVRDAEHAPHVDGQRMEVFLTEEAAIDPELLATAVIGAVGDHPAVELLLDTQVLGAARRNDSFDVHVVGSDDRRTTVRAPVVVNCLWDDRLRVDATVGIESPVSTWTYRIKHQVVVRPRGGTIEPVTMVQGPFGDIVPRADGRVALSWYPICRTRLGSAPLPRTDDPHARAEMASATLAVMSSLYPALEGADVLEVRGGMIVAPGAGDIDDPASGLHIRTNAAVHEHDGWWSIDTSKLTLAPLLAHEAATRIEDRLRA